MEGVFERPPEAIEQVQDRRVLKWHKAVGEEMRKVGQRCRGKWKKRWPRSPFPLLQYQAREALIAHKQDPPRGLSQNARVVEIGDECRPFSGILSDCNETRRFALGHVWFEGHLCSACAVKYIRGWSVRAAPLAR